MTDVFIIDNFPKGTHQQKKVTITNGRPRFYENQELKQARAFYMNKLKEVRPSKPYTQPLAVELTFIYEKKNARCLTPRQEKPDCDNLAKLVLDCMEACGYFANDSQVTDLHIKKFNGSKRQLIVYISDPIEPLED